MKMLLTLCMLFVVAHADNDDYYSGSAKNYCKQAVRVYVDANADHEYWFGAYNGLFFTVGDFAYDTALFSGDNLKIKNRLGQFVQYRYTCVYRTDMREVILINVHQRGLGKREKAIVSADRRY